VEINLKIHTDDEKLSEICTLYWRLGEENKFVYTIAAIEKHFSLKAGDAKKIAFEHSVAFSRKFSCHRCGTLYIFENRSDYTERLKYGIHNEWICKDCTEILKGEAREKHRQVLEERRNSLIRNYDLNKIPQQDINLFSLQDAVYFLAMVRQGASESLELI
jgi:superfamily II helicase